MGGHPFNGLPFKQISTKFYSNANSGRSIIRYKAYIKFCYRSSDGMIPGLYIMLTYDTFFHRSGRGILQHKKYLEQGAVTQVPILHHMFYDRFNRYVLVLKGYQRILLKCFKQGPEGRRSRQVIS